MEIKKKNILLLVILFLVFLLAFFFLSNQQKKIEQGNLLEVTLLNSEGNKIKFSVEIADTDAERQQGLSSREKLPEDRGMFFIFDSEQTLNFWMPDMKFPLDIIFFDSNYKIVDIAENAQPCATKSSCPVYVSKPAKYVLEVNAGIVKKDDIRVGDKVIV